MGRVTKPRAAPLTKEEAEIAAAARAFAPDADANVFLAAVEAFKAEHPEAWEECRRWPTQSGVEFIAEKLKA